MYDPSSPLRLSPATVDALYGIAAAVLFVALFVIAYAFGG